MRRGLSLLAVSVLAPITYAQPASPAVNTLSIPIDTSAQVVSETYLGMLACADCSGTRVEIALYWEGHDGRTPIAYHETETPIGVPDRLPLESSGFFTEQVLQDSAQSTGGPLGGSLVQLTTGKPVLVSFLRVAGNSGELLLLNGQLRVWPENLPHTLGRVTGEQQHRLMLLTERDDGHTITLKGGEVFLVVLPIHSGSGYLWSADYPSAMALLEPASEKELGRATSSPDNSKPVAASSPATPARQSRTVSRHLNMSRSPVPAGPTYQAWQMVAPPEETQPVERTLVFRLQMPEVKDALPARIVTLHIAVP